jgi:uncharacterized protein YutD
MHELNNHASIEEKKNKFKYYCEYCDIGCFYENFINNHNKTQKHKYKSLTNN